MAESNVGTGVAVATAAAAVVGGIATYQAAIGSIGTATDEFNLVRFLNQATFGASPADLSGLQKLGIDAWLDDQRSAARFNARAHDIATKLDSDLRAVALAKADASKVAGTLDAAAYAAAVKDANDRNFIGNREFQRIILWLMLTGDDQLRQRAAFALSEVFVVSLKVIGNRWATHMVANFYDVLRDNAFGNFRDLLKQVTLSSAMGLYLNMSGNFDRKDGVKPDENYAREILQLMSIGLTRLKNDGTPQLDAKGLPIPTYNQADISGLASALTGWKVPSGRGPKAMTANPNYHSLGEKAFLGKTLPALSTKGATSKQLLDYQNAELEAALDVIFKHDAVGPFIALRLIQRLTKSNPSPGYINRVASVFNNNGLGVRGDLFAVIKAVLKDTEARPQTLDAYCGRLREPLLRFTHFLRAFDAKDVAGRPSASAPGQADVGAIYPPFTANTVFNFWSPDYAPLNSTLAQNGLHAPEMQEVYTSSSVTYVNTMINAVKRGGITPQLEHKIDYGALADDLVLAQTGRLDTDRALARLDLLLCGGFLGAPLKAQIRTTWANIVPNKATPSADDLRQVRVVQLKAAITLIMLSIDYLIQF